MDEHEWARTLLVGERSVSRYAAHLEQWRDLALDNAPPCEEPHIPWEMHESPRIVVETSQAGPPCARVEASEFVTLLVNGAGTVIGAVVRGAPVVSTEG